MKKTENSLPKMEQLHLHHKPFWIGFVSFFIISIMFIMSYIYSPTLTGDAAVQTISFMKEGSELHFEVRNVKGVKDVTITILDDVKNGVIKFDETTPAFQGISYSAFRVSSADEAKFGKIVFTLKLPELDLQELGINSNEIILYHNGKALVTESGKVIGGYIIYSAASPGMGEFVIGKAEMPAVDKIVKEPIKDVTVEEKEEPQERMPAPIPEEAIATKRWWQRFLGFWKNVFS